MALQTTGSAGLSVEMKTFYDKVLLERALPKLIHSKFGQKKAIPRHQGKIIEFRKFAGLSTATTPLTEGGPFTDFKELTATAQTATVAQYGDAMAFSDVVSTTTFDPVLTEASEILGEQAGETIDELVRDVLNAGTSVIYANSRADRTYIANNATDYITVADLRKVALQLEINRARKIDGFWQCILHPRVAYDIQATDEWKTANQYHQTGRQFDGSLGTLYGVKFWTTDKAKVWANASNGSGSTGNIDVYSSLFFGQDAFGVVDLAGHNLQTIYKPLGSAGTADPLNQQQSMGWKVTFGTTIIYQPYMVRYESTCSTATNT